MQKVRRRLISYCREAELTRRALLMPIWVGARIGVRPIILPFVAQVAGIDYH